MVELDLAFAIQLILNVVLDNHPLESLAMNCCAIKVGLMKFDIFTVKRIVLMMIWLVWICHAIWVQSFFSKLLLIYCRQLLIANIAAVS